MLFEKHVIYLNLFVFFCKTTYLLFKKNDISKNTSINNESIAKLFIYLLLAPVYEEILAVTVC